MQSWAYFRIQNHESGQYLGSYPGRNFAEAVEAMWDDAGAAPEHRGLDELSGDSVADLIQSAETESELDDVIRSLNLDEPQESYDDTAHRLREEAETDDAPPYLEAAARLYAMAEQRWFEMPENS